MTRPSRALVGVAALAVAGSLALPVLPAVAVSPDVVISEVYGGGGNSGASQRFDFVELRNLGTAAVDLDGWSVQYASATGDTWQVTGLTGRIEPGERYLVQQAQGSGGTEDLPAPDAVGNISMSAVSGKVALVTTTASLPCGIDCDRHSTVQDDNGPVDDGTTTAEETLRLLTEAIARAGGPAYDWRQIDPVDKAEGGQPGGNIRVAFLFNTDRDVEFVDRGTPTSTTPAAVVTGPDGGTHLVTSPARVAPDSPAWAGSRVPLVGEFRRQGQTFFAIANHFSSKGGDDPLFGRWQPQVRTSEVDRHQQAREVRDFVDELLAADPDAKVAVVGDINDFEFSETVDILVGAGETALTDLPRTLPAGERYTYVYEGNSQVLDHILLSPGFVAAGYDYDIVHVNAEFADQISDHDPQVVRIVAARDGHGKGGHGKGHGKARGHHKKHGKGHHKGRGRGHDRHHR